ncbi:Ribosomal protein S21 family protein [Raphanus sativus]|uniref:30S ribosomal protein S21, chloroplastic n=1 Tax=Raphanus sativus TaxID=3726 RepID=A0A6J0LR01_RAPSA|nr:30S ribosomal protein S21, chloroplastic [Raphanus sativus]KAJ4888271.1 Ribosomal protein S21 family protein [Raphanus sativus]
MASSLSLTSFISSISPFKSQTKPSPPPPSLTLPTTQTVSHNRRKNDLAVEEPPSTTASLSSELASVICPSLAYSNTLFFSSPGYNVQVFVEDNESEERLVNRFRREVMRTGVIQECKRRRYFENKQDEKKRRTRDAAKRNKKRRPQARFSQETREEAAAATKSKKKDAEEDNWEWAMPDGDVPS